MLITYQAKYNNGAEEQKPFRPAITKKEVRMTNQGYLSEPSGSLADANIISIDKNPARPLVRTPIF